MKALVADTPRPCVVTTTPAPHIARLGLSPEALLERRKGIGGSDAVKIMNGDWLQLWEEKTGRRESDDLSAILPVQLGLYTEPFNAHWFELTTGRKITHRSETRTHAEYAWMRCTLDGLTDGGNTVWQAKHVNAFLKIEDVCQRYMPQVHHEMAVCGLDKACLSVIIGTMNFEPVDIAADDFYMAQLIDRERLFWRYVENDEPPAHFDPIVSPVAPERWRTVSMEGRNEWASHAGEWLGNRNASKKFEKAAKSVKALMEADVGTASGHGIICTRAKNGALTIKET